MIKIKFGGEVITFKKVKISFSKDIRDILPEYMGRRRVDDVIAKLKDLTKNWVTVVAERNGELFELCKGSFQEAPIVFRNPLEIKISICRILMENGLKEYEVGDCMASIYSFEEVPETSNEETEEFSQGEAETLGT